MAAKKADGKARSKHRGNVIRAVDLWLRALENDGDVSIGISNEAVNLSNQLRQVFPKTLKKTR